VKTLRANASVLGNPGLVIALRAAFRLFIGVAPDIARQPASWFAGGDSGTKSISRTTTQT
jgi:hypothetical protein